MKSTQETKQNESPKNAGESRDEQGRFIKGVSGNPEGKPKGAGISITTAIKRELEKVPEGQKSTYLDLLVKKILKKGIVDGDNQTQRNIWNYIDGMPRQTIGMDGGLDEDNQPKPLLGGNSNGVPDNDSDKETAKA